MKQYLVATTPKFFVTNKYTLAKWHMEDIIIKKLTSPMVNTVGVETVNKYWTPFYFSKKEKPDLNKFIFISLFSGVSFLVINYFFRLISIL